MVLHKKQAFRGKQTGIENRTDEVFVVLPAIGRIAEHKVIRPIQPFEESRNISHDKPCRCAHADIRRRSFHRFKGLTVLLDKTGAAGTSAQRLETEIAETGEQIENIDTLEIDPCRKRIENRFLDPAAARPDITRGQMSDFPPPVSARLDLHAFPKA